MEVVSRSLGQRVRTFGILFFFFILMIGGILLFAEHEKDRIGGIIFSALFGTGGIFINYITIRNSTKIVLNKKGILYKKKFYDWEDLMEVSLTGKGYILFGAVGECMTLKFKNLEPIQIFDKFYANSAEMKYFIQQIVINKAVSFNFKTEKHNSYDIDRETFFDFKGSPLFSLRGILLWSLIISLVGITILGGRKLPLLAYLIISGVCILWFSFHASMMYYFEISKNYFVVKNHYFFWKKEIYPIAEIREIVFERLGKQPNTLRLITTKFESKLFHAGTLTDTTWLEMQDELIRKNITVRNECI